MTSEAKQHVEKLLEAGDKIEAIKYLKNTYHFSLEESKILVEALEQTMAPENTIPADNDTLLDPLMKARIAELLQKHKRMEAIKLVRSEFKLPLQNSGRIVDNIERELFPERVRKKEALITRIFSSIGILLVVIAGVVFYNQSQSIGNSDLVSGKVVKLEFDGQGSAPLIEYVWMGKKQSYQSTTYSSPPAYSVNEVVPVYVNRDRPDDIIIDTFMDRWFIITILGGIGFLFIAITYLVTRLVHNRFNNPVQREARSGNGLRATHEKDPF